MKLIALVGSAAAVKFVNDPSKKVLAQNSWDDSSLSYNSRINMLAETALRNDPPLRSPIHSRPGFALDDNYPRYDNPHDW
jgi:hypothetical protein